MNHDTPLNYFKEDNFSFFRPKRTGSSFDFASIRNIPPESGYYTGPIDFAKLVRKLSGERKEGCPSISDFYYKDYISNSYVTHTEQGMRKSFGEYKVEPVTYTRHIDTPFSYKEGNKSIPLGLDGRINKKIGEVRTKGSYRVKIDLSEEEAIYFLNFHYDEDTEIHKNDEFLTIGKWDPELEEVTSKKKRILAVEISSTKYEDFVQLAKQFNFDPEGYVFRKFKEVYDSLGSDDLSKRNNFYKQAPVEFLSKLTFFQLFFDLEDLLKYDKKKWFIDNSDAMLKALGVIISKEEGIEQLYQAFNADPSRIKKIYHFLDGEGKSDTHGGETIPNKTIFASILNTLCNHNAQGYIEERLQTDIVFSIAKGHRVDSNVLRSNDKSEDKYDLTQEVKKTKIVTENLGGGFADGSVGIDRHTYEKDLGWFTEGETHSLHPLDLVTLIIEGPDGESVSLVVPAIMVKDLAHHREWAEIQKAIRIGLDIFIIVISIATLLSGPGPLLLALSIIDLGLATADLTIQSFEEEIRSLEGGPEFLDAWEKIYLFASILTTLPLLGNLLRNGAKILAQVTSVEVRQQLILMLKYALQQSKNLPKFIKGQFEIIPIVAKYPALSKIAPSIASIVKSWVISYIWQKKL